MDSSVTRDWQNDESHNNYRWYSCMALSCALIAGGVTVKALTEYVLADELTREKTGLDKDTNTPSTEGTNVTLQEAIQQARTIVKRKMVVCGCPGLVIAVSVNGNTVLKEGLGYSDIENNIPCKPETVFRIASISKPITMAAVAKLWENGDLDLDKTVNEYLPDFPQKTWEGKNVDITVRQLLSHMSGIRHYDKKYMKENVLCISQIMHYSQNKHGRIENAPYVDQSYKWAGEGLISNVYDLIKFGNAMLYSYQAQSPRGSSEGIHLSKSAAPIHYNANTNGRDVLFSVRNNSMLSNDTVPYLKSETVKKMWTSVDKTVCEWGGLTGGGYGLGWGVWHIVNKHAFCKTRPFFMSHEGGAVGASGVLLILPSASGTTIPVKEHRMSVEEEKENGVVAGDAGQPNGVVVSIIVNLTSVGLNKTALDVAELFDHVK